jgi:hypothetical protein
MSDKSENDDDLYRVYSILVTSSWNKNDDIFSPEEVWAARDTPVFKPTNLEHKDKKPPLGLMSKTFWEERRILDIIEAIDRYIGAGKSIPRDWVDEFNDLIQKRVDK